MSRPEEWRPVLGYEGFYEVSSQGRVRSLSRTRQARRRNGTEFTMRMVGRELVLCLNKDGYLQGNVCVDGVRKNFEVHRLVCEAFHGPAPEGYEAAHNDGIRTNCHEGNLRWATPAGNAADRDRHGTVLRGEAHPRAKLTEVQVKEIRSSPRSGYSLARELGVHPSVIKNIRSRKIWRSVA